MDWMQVGAFIVAVLGLGLAGIVYVTRQLNRQFDRIYDRFDQIDARMTLIEERIGAVEQEQVRFGARLDSVEEGLQEVRGEVKTLNDNVQNLEKEQARMLGFLEGRGVMGKAPPEPERAA